MNEDKIINSLKEYFPFQNGIGDDAAIFDNYVISKDLLIEDIHFCRKYTTLSNLAYKVVQVNLSDIAAMGACPLYIMLGIAIPKHYKEQDFQEFLDYFAQVCLNEKIILIGGDTVASTDKLAISITIIGKADKPIYRSGAQVGDIVCVAGDIGYAHLGLIALENNLKIPDQFINALLRPKARLEEGKWLAKQGVTSMMDISDGLLLDFRKLCKASNLGGIINVKDLTSDKNLTTTCDLLNLDTRSVQLTGGEDYGLLFTIKVEHYDQLSEKFLEYFSYKIKKIGVITNGDEVSFDQAIQIKQKVFSHFGEL